MIQEPETRPEPVAGKMVLVLSLAGLLSGVAIVGVYVMTLPRIERNRAEALRRAVFQVVPGATQMQQLVYRDGSLQPEDGGPAIYAAYDEQAKFCGYAIPSQGAGFQDTIRLIYGYQPLDQRIVGMAILESKETPGLGDKIFKDLPFQENFKQLAVEPEIVTVKNGTKTAPHEIDAITGATISSKAIAKILNSGNAQWLKRLPEPGSEPSMPASTKQDEDH